MEYHMSKGQIITYPIEEEFKVKRQDYCTKNEQNHKSKYRHDYVQQKGITSQRTNKTMANKKYMLKKLHLTFVQHFNM